MTATATPAQSPPRRSRFLAALEWCDRHPVPVFAVLGVLVAGMYLLNLSTSPDFTADEVVYAGLSRNIAAADAISLTGPFLVHPPLDFFLGAWWADLTGTADSPVLTTLLSIRLLGALCCLFTAIITGVTARDLLGGTGAGRRAAAGIVATLLVATNGFMLSFGRTALIEPAAVAAGAGVVFAAYRLRHRPIPQQVMILGVLIGLGTLIKQTVVFVSMTPLLVGLLQRNGRKAMTGATAVLIGGVIWSSFPIWAAVNGNGASFWSQQSVSIQRLIGLLHTSGVTLPNGSPATQFVLTFGLYASGYAALLTGTVGLAAMVVHCWRPSGARRPDDAVALLLAYGLLSYGFLGYSFAFGAGNQQFMIYSVPASALLCSWLFFGRHAQGGGIGSNDDSGRGHGNGYDSGGGDPNAAGTGGDGVGGGAPEIPEAVGGGRMTGSRRLVTGILIGLLLGVGLLGWVRYDVVQLDDGTAQVADYVAAGIAPCVPINASGSRPRWAAALPNNPVTFYRSGAEALAGNQHLFLLSPKDVRYGYGNMSPALADWITTQGRLLFRVDSRSSEELQLWVVGDIPSAPGTCATAAVQPSSRAPGTEYLVLLGTVLTVIIAGGALATAAIRRHRAAVASPPGSGSAH